MKRASSSDAWNIGKTYPSAFVTYRKDCFEKALKRTDKRLMVMGAPTNEGS